MAEHEDPKWKKEGRALVSFFIYPEDRDYLEKLAGGRQKKSEFLMELLAWLEASGLSPEELRERVQDRQSIEIEGT